MKRATSKPLSKRAALAAAEELARAATRRAEELRRELLDERRELPEEGSTWRKHPAALQEHAPDWTWTYTGWAFLDDTGSQLALIRLSPGSTNSGRAYEPYTKAVPMDRFLLDYVPCSLETARGRRSKARAR